MLADKACSQGYPAADHSDMQEWQDAVSLTDQYNSTVFASSQVFLSTQVITVKLGLHSLVISVRLALQAAVGW